MYRVKLLFLLVLATAFAVGCGGPEGEAPEVPSEVRASQFETSVLPAFTVQGEPVMPQPLAARMAHFGVPGVSVAVINNGQIEWARGYGVADVESGQAVTPETMFQAASISKPVAAIGALRLVESGLLQLDDDVNNLLRSWQVPDSEFSTVEKVTLRRLLNHTAGTTVWGFPGYADEPIPSTVGVLEGQGNTDPITVWKTPGESWRYSGGGYTVAQLLLEDVTGRPFNEVMEELVLQPVGMNDSRYEHPLSEPFRDQAAHGHDREGNTVGKGWHHYPELAAAGLWTTPSDLARLAIRIQQTFTGRNRIMNRALVQVMLSPGENNWGLGPVISEDRLRFSHGGSNAGFRCELTAFIEDGRGAVIMTNSDNGDALIAELMVTLATIYDWPGMEAEEKVVVALTGQELDAVAGTYDLGVLGRVTVAVENGKLIAGLQGQTTELRPTGATTFFIADTGMSVGFDPDTGTIEVAGLRGQRQE